MTPDERLAEVLGRPVTSVGDAAWVAGMSRSWVYAAVRSGEIEATRVGRRVLVKTDSLKRILGVDQA